MESKYLARMGFGKEIFRRSLNYRYALGLPGIVIKTEGGRERGITRGKESYEGRKGALRKFALPGIPLSKIGWS